MSDLKIPDAVVDWLLASDPSVAWQTERDLLDAPEADWHATRARTETEGWCARLLSQAGEDGLFDGGACFPHPFSEEMFAAERGQPWTATMPTLAELRRLGLPGDCPTVQRLVPLIRANGRWEFDDLPFFDGEVEPCINGQTVAIGSWLGVDMGPLVERLLGEAMADGGWNCEQEKGSTRSSCHTTICVVEGLLGYERWPGADPGLAERARAARVRGEEYLLTRRLFRRASTGEVIDPDFLLLRNPDRWYYSTLRALDHLRDAHPAGPDPRAAEALDGLRAKQLPDGRFPLEVRAPGRVWFHPDEVGEPSPTVTLRALRVLRWAGAA